MKWYKRLCEEGFINAIFNKFDGVRCEMHVNDTSMNPCDDVFGERRLEENTLGEYICKPQNCTVSWAFATTMSIEYAIKKLYFEEYDQIVEVALSAQELIDCVGKEHGVTGKVCDGLPLAWAFDYIYENGIAYREFYHHTNKEEECMINKYHISGYE